MDEFENLMREHDLGGAIILHHKDTSAFKLFMAPNYSITEEVKNTDDEVVSFRFRTKGLPADLKEQKVRETCNLFHTVSDVMMRIGYGLAEVSDNLDKVAGAEYTDPD